MTAAGRAATPRFLPARAKLNLVLRVVGRRADGYHLLETLYHALALHDDVWLAPAASEAGAVALTVTAERPELVVGAGPENLVAKALAAFARAAPSAHGFRAHLHKRIPSGAGLGGGSSDAAAALRLANTFAERTLDDAALHDIARTLGADVPFLLRSGSSWGRGVGDELEHAPHDAQRFLLLVPPFPCATAAVYEKHAALWHGANARDSVPHATDRSRRDRAVRSERVNELEAAAEAVQPELASLRRAVEGAGYGDVRMTGSGSTLFLAFTGDAAGDDALRAAELRLAFLRELGVRLVATESGPAVADTPLARPWPPR